MAVLVEMFGSPGVGKTTLYKEIASNWRPDSSWIPGYDLIPKENIEIRNIKSMLLYLAYLLKINNLKDNNGYMKEAGDRFISDNPEYINLLWNYIMTYYKVNDNNKDLRFSKSAYLYRLIQRVQSVKEAKSNKIAILDEGLTHFFETGSNQLNKIETQLDEIKKILLLKPLPEAIIHIDLDIQENIKRIRSRPNTLRMHRSLEDNDLEMLYIQSRKIRCLILDHFEMHNIPILKINGSESVKKNAQLIEKFTEEIKKKKLLKVY